VTLGFAQGAAPEDSCADALGRLLAAGVPVLGLTLEGGRLSDAFLSLTGEG
jgi:ABC-2 type transport system ATP-binding protein